MLINVRNNAGYIYETCKSIKIFVLDKYNYLKKTSQLYNTATHSHGPIRRSALVELLCRPARVHKDRPAPVRNIRVVLLPFRTQPIRELGITFPEIVFNL